MLANALIKEINPDAITIAEDVSAYPTLCRSISDGGIGFDYRFNMGVVDLWNSLLNTPDNEWSMKLIVEKLCSRRYKEKVISYCECHDQAIRGNKTIIMKLLGDNIYNLMTKHDG